MAHIFAKCSALQPDWTDEDGDPFSKIDKITATRDDITIKDSDDEEAITKKLASATTRAKSKAADSIDWLPHELKELVKKHAPKENDIDGQGRVNKERLEEEATKLFGGLERTRTFVNIYQLKALVNKFGELWGFLVITQDNCALKCYFGESSSKPREKEVTPTKQRQRTSVKGDCGFVVRGAFHPGMRGNCERHRLPCRISSFTVKHGDNCHPSVLEFRIAKKKTGAVFAKLDLFELGDSAETIACPNTTARQIRQLLRKHIPDGYAITADDVRNVKQRALKYYLEEKPLDSESAKKLVEFKPLDDNEMIVLPDTDLCRARVKELMREAMRDSETGCGFRTLDFLATLKEKSPGFDFAVKREEGRPSAVVWMTPSMRKAWIRYGNVIFLDAMKRKLNSLHWKYIGPVALDNEKRIVQLCECLCVEEEIAYYAWVLQKLEEFEPRRKLISVRLMYADGLLTDTLLNMLGLEHPNVIGSATGTDLIWDSHHLSSSVWPDKEGLGQATYDLVRDDMLKMLYGSTRQECDEAYSRIAVKLQSNPRKLEYVKDYYDHPERFAKHYVKRIPGNLDKTSSQPAESNHASVLSHLGRGSTQDMVMQISDLLDRQNHREEKYSHEDHTYRMQSHNEAKAAEEGNNVAEAMARRKLSAWALNEFYFPAVDGAQHYEMLPDQGDEFDRVLRKGKPADTARLIPKSGRCGCDEQVCAESMCRHEKVRIGNVFDETLFPERLFQQHEMQPIPTSVAAANANALPNANATSNATVMATISNATAMANANSAMFDATATANANAMSNAAACPMDEIANANANDSDTDSDRDNIFLTELAKETTGQKRNRAPSGESAVGDSQAAPKKQKITKVSQKEMLKVSQDVVYRAQSLPPKECNIIYSLLLQLQQITKGESNCDPMGVAESARLASRSFSSRCPQTGNNMMPLVGSESGKSGRPRTSRMASSVMARNGGTAEPKSGKRSCPTCSFCRDPKCRNILSCMKLRAIGKRLKKEEVDRFVRVAFSVHKAKYDPAKLSLLITDKTPLLTNLPRNTSWLLVRQLCVVKAMPANMGITEDDVGVQVTCYGAMGVVLPALSSETGNFEDRIVKYTAVREWISKNKTKLIVDAEFEGW